MPVLTSGKGHLNLIIINRRAANTPEIEMHYQPLNIASYNYITAAAQRRDLQAISLGKSQGLLYFGDISHRTKILSVGRQCQTV